MISVLLIFLLFGVIQVAVVFYVRNIIAASASDGARYGASSNVDVRDGATRATSEIRGSLSDSIADGVPCTSAIGRDPVSGLQTAVVHCVGNIHSAFLPIGSFVHIDVTARALAEPHS